jgi:hypothetical protein
MFQFRYLGNLIPQNYRELYKDLWQSKPYAEIVDYAVKTWVAPDETERFLKEASVASMVAHLDEKDSYTINLKSRRSDAAEGWKQLRLTWLDETKDWILIQQADVTEAVHMQQAELLKTAEYGEDPAQRGGQGQRIQIQFHFQRQPRYAHASERDPGL